MIERHICEETREIKTQSERDGERAIDSEWECERKKERESGNDEETARE